MTAQSLYRRIIRLRGVKIKFVYLKDDKHELFGTYGEGIIRINLHKQIQPIKTFIHEATHHFFPQMSEKEVMEWEGRVWEMLTIKQKVRLYKALFAGK